VRDYENRQSGAEDITWKDKDVVRLMHRKKEEKRGGRKGRQRHAREGYIAMHLSGRSASFGRGCRLLC